MNRTVHYGRLLSGLAIGIAMAAMVVFVSPVQSADGPSLGPSFGAPEAADESSEEGTAGEPAQDASPDDKEESAQSDTPSDEPATESDEEQPAAPPKKLSQPRAIQAVREPKPIAPSTEEPKPIKSESTNDEGIVIDSGEDGDAMIRQAYALTQNATSLDQLSEVIDLLKRALKNSPSESNSDYARTLMAWAHNKRGERYAADKRDEEALDEFATAISLDFKNWRAAHNRGVSYAMMGKYEQALEDFNRAIALNRNYANSWYNRGELRYEKGDYEGAADDYGQAIRLAPQDPAAYNSRGHAFYRLNRIPEAMRDYDRAVQLDPENAAILTNRGDAHAHQANYAAAARDFREAIRVNPQLGRAYQSAAWLMATCPDPRFRNRDLGLDAAQRAIELDGEDDFRYLDTLAAAYANAGQFDAAVEAQNKAIELQKGEESESLDEALEERLALYHAEKPYRENDGVTSRPIGPQNVRSAPPRRNIVRQPANQQITRQRNVRQQPQTTRSQPRRQYRTPPTSAQRQR